jgi:hypothetical protein
MMRTMDWCARSLKPNLSFANQALIFRARTAHVGLRPHPGYRLDCFVAGFFFVPLFFFADAELAEKLSWPITAWCRCPITRWLMKYQIFARHAHCYIGERACWRQVPLTFQAGCKLSGFRLLSEYMIVCGDSLCWESLKGTVKWRDVPRAPACDQPLVGDRIAMRLGSPGRESS